MLNVEHIGIAVKDFANAVPLFEKLLNSQCYKTEEVKTENAYFLLCYCVTLTICA